MSGGLVRGFNGATLNLDFSTVVGIGLALATGSSGTAIVVSDSIISGQCLLQGGGSIGFVDANVWDDPSCGAGNVPDLGLMPLGDYGGPTRTHALLATSPALEAGILRCLLPPVSGVDQRGESRPVGTFCDLGAYELPEPGAALGLASGGGLLAILRRRRRRR